MSSQIKTWTSKITPPKRTRKSSRLQILKRLRPKLTTKATVIIYQPMILPLVTNCSLVTYSRESYMKKPKSLHSHADQIIGNNAKQSLLKPIDSTMKKHLCSKFKTRIQNPDWWTVLYCLILKLCKIIHVTVSASFGCQLQVSLTSSIICETSSIILSRF